MKKIGSALIIDDDDAFRRALQGALRRRAVRAITAATVDEGLIQAQDDAFDLVVIDYRMPRRDGLSAIARLRQLRADAVIIMLTGFGDIPLAVAAVREGADTLMTKPVDADRLIREAMALREVLPERSAPPPSSSGRTYRLEELERQTIEAALHDSGGVVAAAARLLGIDRRTLQRKLKKQG
jgi:two-component system, response regulator RegA